MVKRLKPTKRLVPYVVLLFSLITGASIIQPISEFVRSRLESFQEEIIGLFKQETGLDLRYESISPSILLQANIKNLELIRTDGSVLLHAEQVSIGYNIFDFLFGAPLDALHDVRILNAEIEILLDRDAALIGNVSVGETGVLSFQDGLVLLSETLPQGISFQFENANTVFSSDTGSGALLVHNAVFTAFSDRLETSISVDMQAQNLLPALSEGNLQGRVHLSGSYFKANGDIQASLGFERLRTPWGNISPQSFALLYTGSSVMITKVEDQQPFDLSVGYDIRNDKIEVKLQTERWRPGVVFTPSVAMPQILTSLLQSTYTADATIVYDNKTALVDYKFFVNGSGSYDPFGPLTLIAGGEGQGTGVSLDILDIQAPGLSLAYKGRLSLSAEDILKGTQDIPDFAGSGRFSIVGDKPLSPIPFEVAGYIKTENGALIVSDSDARVHDVPFSLPSARFAFSGRDVHTDARLVFPSGSDGETGAVALVADLNLDLSSEFSTGIEFQTVSFDTLYALLSGNVIETGMVIDGSLGLDADIFRLMNTDWSPFTLIETIDADTESLVLSESRDGGTRIAATDLMVKDKAFNVSKIEITLGDFAGLIKASGSLGDDGILSFSTVSEIVGIGQFNASGTLDATGNFDVSSSQGMRIHGAAVMDQIQGFVNVEKVPLSSVGPLSYLTAIAQFSYRSIDEWLVDIDNFEVTAIPFNPVLPGKPASIVVRDGLLGPVGGELTGVSVSDGISTLTGTIGLTYVVSNLRSLTWNASLDGPRALGTGTLTGDRERLLSTGVIGEGRLTGNISLANSPIARFLDVGLRGVFTVSADINGELNALSVKGNVFFPRAFLNNDPLILSSDLSYSDGVFALSNFRAQIWENRIGITAFSLNSVERQLTFSASIEHMRNPRPRPLVFRGSVKWPDTGAPSQDGMSSGLEGQIFIDNLPDLDGADKNYRISITANDSGTYFTEVASRAVSGVIRTDGSFVVQAQAPFPFTASATGRFVQGELDLTVGSISFGLRPVTQPFLNDYFTFSDGIVTGSLRVTGEINDPDFFGSLKATNITAHLELTPDSVEVETAYLVFEEKRVRVLPAKASIGEVSADINADITLSRWLPQTYAIRAKIHNGRGLHVKSDFASIGVDGYATGDVTVEIGEDTIAIRGDIEVSESTLWMSPSNASTASQSGENAFQFLIDLGFKTGRLVEFVWPNRSAPILSSTLDIGQSARFALNQRANTFRFDGTVSARGGELTYLRRSFYIREAEIVFRESDSLGFDPLVTLRAEMRAFNGNTPIRITAILEKSRLSDMRPRFESDPAISSNQLSAILAGDFSEIQSGRDNLQQFIDFVGFYSGIGDIPVLRELERTIKTVVGLDQLSFRTGIFSELATDLVGQVLSPNNPLDNQSNSLGKYFDNTTLVMGKYFGTDVYLEALVQVSALDAVAFDQSSPLGLSVNFELNMEWSTPFFLLNWNFAPKDVQRLFLPDNTFTFSWRL